MAITIINEEFNDDQVSVAVKAMQAYFEEVTHLEGRKYFVFGKGCPDDGTLIGVKLRTKAGKTTVTNWEYIQSANK